MLRRYFKDQSFETDYPLAAIQAACARTRLRRALKRRKHLDRQRSQRHRTGRDLCVEPQGENPGAAVPRARGNSARLALAQRKPYHYKSSDGLDIPAYLTLPKGLAAKNLPLVVYPHGGPWGRDSYGYDTNAQFLANRGYAVLQPNFRASTGYGKKFLNAGNGEWGRKMQDDITWGVKALVAARCRRSEARRHFRRFLRRLRHARRRCVHARLFMPPRSPMSRRRI